MKRTNITLTAETETRLGKVARNEDIEISEIAEELLMTALDELDDDELGDQDPKRQYSWQAGQDALAQNQCNCCCVACGSGAAKVDSKATDTKATKVGDVDAQTEGSDTDTKANDPEEDSD